MATVWLPTGLWLRALLITPALHTREQGDGWYTGSAGDTWLPTSHEVIKPLTPHGAMCLPVRALLCPDMGPPPGAEFCEEKRFAVQLALRQGTRSSLTLPVDRTPFQMQKKQTSQTKRRQSARSHFRAPGWSIPGDRLSTLRL